MISLWKCIATGAHPAPEFQWYIDNIPLDSPTIETSEEAVDDGKNHYISALQYFASSKNHNKNIKCKVTHKGGFLSEDRVAVVKISKQSQCFLKRQ